MAFATVQRTKGPDKELQPQFIRAPEASTLSVVSPAVLLYSYKLRVGFTVLMSFINKDVTSDVFINIFINSSLGSFYTYSV